jgi:outer membrane lipoprotein SlyB
MSKSGIVLGATILTLAVVACAQDDTTQSNTTTTRTERQKDSILAGSQIPGARAVKKAMTVADSASARGAAVIDTTPQNP